MKMKIDLRTLRDNPLRDFSVDPIDDTDDDAIGHLSAVTKLKRSIRQNGFWGGVVVRKTSNGEYQIAAGHHRVKAALACAEKDADYYADLPVLDLTDDQMVSVYGDENATQRGNTSTASAGTVAAGLYVVALREMRGQTVSGNSGDGKFVHGDPVNGIGAPRVLDYLAGEREIVGVTQHVVETEMQRLRDSGAYTRIIAKARQTVADELAEAERQAREAREAEERRAAEAEAERLRAAEVKAQKLNEQAEKLEQKFDADGVNRVFTKPSHVTEFRKFCVRNGKMVVPFEQQAKLAHHVRQELIKHERAMGHDKPEDEITASKVRWETQIVYDRERGLVRDEERAKLRTRTTQQVLDGLAEEFQEQIDRLTSTGTEIAALLKKKRGKLIMRPSFTNAVTVVKGVIDQLHKEINDVK